MSTWGSRSLAHRSVQRVGALKLASVVPGSSPSSHNTSPTRLRAGSGRSARNESPDLPRKGMPSA